METISFTLFFLVKITWMAVRKPILLKLDSHLPKKIFIICLNDTHSKTIKNAFYFILKALFVLETFKFLSWTFVHLEKRLDKKDKVNFEIDDITAWLTNNYNTHIV